MTATEYPQKLSVENSLGLHYSAFSPFCHTQPSENQSLTTCRIPKLRSNRRSWARGFSGKSLPRTRSGWAPVFRRKSDKIKNWIAFRFNRIGQRSRPPHV